MYIYIYIYDLSSWKSRPQISSLFKRRVLLEAQSMKDLMLRNSRPREGETMVPKLGHWGGGREKHVADVATHFEKHSEFGFFGMMRSFPDAVDYCCVVGATWL